MFKACLVLFVAALTTGIVGFPTGHGADGEIQEANEGHLRMRRDTKIRTLETRRSGCPYASMNGRTVQATADRVKRGVDTKYQGKGRPKRRCVQPEEKCNPEAIDRNPDGSCNNLAKPNWGMTGVRQARFVSNDYDDKASSPRTKDVRGNQLENARVISNAVHAGPSTTPKSNKHTLHMMQWGQFLDHDIILTPIADVEDCCTSPDSNNTNTCFPLLVTEDDPVFSEGHCMDFPRSAENECLQGRVRQQVNEITSFVDGSNVYGSSHEELDMLRKNGTGFLLMSPGDKMPIENDTTCANGLCPVGGDIRSAETPMLTTYHTLFVREHNRIAAILDERFADKEHMFQTVRHIVMAVMQKITYDEFLPALLSPTAMEKYGLSSSEDYVYDDTLDPSILNDFGIAYRLGHTMIPDLVPARVSNTNLVSETPIEETFFDTSLTYKPGLEALAFGLSEEPSGAMDGIVTEGVRSKLFGELDLAALNIQRGRDHGLPGYGAYRTRCGLSPVASWKDMPDHDDDVRDKLMSVYDSPKDIDLWTAVVTERPVTGGSIGPVGECIVGEQFRRLKYGDRFWYQGTVYDFNQAQLDTIQQYSLAKVLCHNFKFFWMRYPNVFLTSDALTSCSEIPDLDDQLLNVMSRSTTMPSSSTVPTSTNVPDSSTMPSSTTVPTSSFEPTSTTAPTSATAPITTSASTTPATDEDIGNGNKSDESRSENTPNYFQRKN